MVELTIVAAIIALLVLLALLNIPKIIIRARDGRRKSDLAAYKIALEHYYEDHRCYPTAALLANCNSPSLQPYLPKILCDPSTVQPYTYVSNQCDSFLMYTKLKDTSDRDIEALGCSSGCGPDENNDGNGDYNYGIASGNENVGSLAVIWPSGTCALAHGKTCYAGVCSACCPDGGFRCDSTGTKCTPDASCDWGQ